VYAPEQPSYPGETINGFDGIVPGDGPMIHLPGFDSDNPPWGLPAAFLTWFLSVVLLLFLPPIIALPYLIHRYQSGANLSRDALLADKNFIFFNIAGVIPAHLVTLGVVWAVATRFGRFPFWQSVGWAWPKRFGFWKSAGLAVILLGVGIAILSRFGGQPTEMERIILSSRLNACTTAFLATATAPLVEELIYRGILYSALRRVVGMGGAVLIVMSLFTAVHVPQYWPNFGVLSTILLLSLSLTLVRARTGRLLPCFVIHLVFNGLQSLMIVFEQYLPDLDKLLQRQGKGAALLTLLLRFHW
jgi:membrane protease YdiL (CAAX protease family)